jgi:ATP-dependent Zn protease
MLAVTGGEPATPRLSELHGLGEARQWGLDLVRDLQDYEAGRLPWAAVSKGILLSGPPGTGKTSYARALGKEAGANFVATSYSQWQSSKDGHLGAVTAAIRASFADAARTKPAILFIDEIDTLPRRGSARYDEWWTAIVNTVLDCIDGFERLEGVVVMAACNDPSRLDPALVRAGRLDTHIQIPLPDTASLIGIIRYHLGDDLAGVDLLHAAIAARGRTGADVERWVRIARRVARIAQRPLTLDDLGTAIRDGEPELPAEFRRRVAYHEAGHAILRIALGVGQLVSMSVHASGGEVESAWGEITADTRANLENYIVCKLAGRASEELVFANVTGGAGGASEMSDLAVVTRAAMQIECAYGLGVLGSIWMANDVGPRDLLLFGDLRRAVARTIETAYATAKAVLTDNRLALDRLAEALLARGYLDRAEIDAVLTQAPPVRSTYQSSPLAALDATPLEPGDTSVVAGITAPDLASAEGDVIEKASP